MRTLLLDIIYLILGVPFALFKAATSPRFRAGWKERMGGVPQLDTRRRFWIHCASVGEVMLIRPLVQRLRAEYPDAHIILSTTTSTGRETALKILPGIEQFYFPFDLTPVLRKAFRRIRPTAVILVELELWPNFLEIARQQHIPVAVVNGRITDRSYRRYKLFRTSAPRMFRKIAAFAVQNDEYAQRFRLLGVDPARITVAGTMKYDSVETDIPPATLDRYRQLHHIRPEDIVLVAGCTHPGEDELFIDYVKERPQLPLRLILAPRHRERVPAVQRLVTDAGFVPVLKTQLDSGTAPAEFSGRPHIFILDTTGELPRVYGFATIVFVGGSIAPHGGHNIIEPAALGKPVVFGPNVRNFREPVELLLRAQAAIQVDGPQQLSAVLDRLIENTPERDDLGRRARTLIVESKGATQRNLAAIRPLLETQAGGAAC